MCPYVDICSLLVSGRNICIHTSETLFVCVCVCVCVTGKKKQLENITLCIPKFPETQLCIYIYIRIYEYQSLCI